MIQKNEHHTFVGMQRDTTISKHPSKYLYDAHNIRLTQREGSTLLAITNEKGTDETGVTISGIYLGHCLLNKYLTIFSTVENPDSGEPKDFIERVDLETLHKDSLYAGDLSFSTAHPIEAIGSYENESIQKVYWTDGENPPRVINIAKTNQSPDDPSFFDFVNNLALNETVKVQKILGANGMFAPGVIQYAFTYYHKYGQESNIFYTTPLLYISNKDRGNSPEDTVVENAFKIVVEHVDTSFNYLRIYSIQRTSVDGTPICKRVQDVSLEGISNNTVSYTDTGTSGDVIDPTELLYKGGETIKAGTIEQKDGTLFLGDIEIERQQVQLGETDVNAIAGTIASSVRNFMPTQISTGDYAYSNQLTSWDVVDNTIDYTKSVPCAGFKYGDYYRLGVQFQYKTGKWSDPIFIDDKKETEIPREGGINTDYEGQIIVPTFTASIPAEVVEHIDSDYKRVRPVVVYPTLKDRVTICQGVANPTVYTKDHRHKNCDLYAQPSWFFRPYLSTNDGVINSDDGTVYPAWNSIPYMSSSITANSEKIKLVEIQGDYKASHLTGEGNRFEVDRYFWTLNSPEIEFDDSFSLIDYTTFTGSNCRQLGHAVFKKTLSDIDIQTSSPAISNGGSGFVHKSFSANNAYGVVSGLFYDDFIVDDDPVGEENLVIEAFDRQRSSVKWMVYLWNKDGSLNNDINRPANLGTATAVLKKKIISNLRYSDTEVIIENNAFNPINCSVKDLSLFASDQLEIIKIKGTIATDPDKIYMGNIDTILTPDYADGMYFAFNNEIDGQGNPKWWIDKQAGRNTPFESSVLWKTYSNEGDNDATLSGLWFWNSDHWQRDEKTTTDGKVGEKYTDLVLKKEGVRMKYKSTPHLIFRSNELEDTKDHGLPIVEIIRDESNTDFINNLFGGTSEDALRECVWIPCGEPVTLNREDNTPTPFEYSWGDTYYQRWDCLKTYPFTREDVNQVVEIGSFMLETHVNIDGRYDRNRGQLSNLYMSPANFNLLNPVYGQLNNFFTYRILDDSFYNLNKFPNQITWTKEKKAGADVDLWTNITLASTYDMDGSKGKVVSLNTWKDQIFCFQDKGISNILFNSRVQIPTSDGVPIEISNGYKVDGYRYLTDGIGCVNKWTIKETPSGIYFIDSVSNNLFKIGENSADISSSCNMQSWFKENNIARTVYDDVNKDLYVVPEYIVPENVPDALCFSEILGQFSSFMSYGGISLIESHKTNVFTLKDNALYKMFAGDYNEFFGQPKPWDITFVSNGLDNSDMDFDKIFTNIDYRLDFFDSEYDPDTTFDFVRAWNEYQDTREVNLSSKSDGKGIKTSKFYAGGNPQKKFRIWRIQIPRAKRLVNNEWKGTNDRIRNPWCTITLGKRNNSSIPDDNKLRAVLQDLNIQYYL